MRRPLVRVESATREHPYDGGCQVKVGAVGDYPSRFRGGIFDLFSSLWYNKSEKHFKNEIEINIKLHFLSRKCLKLRGLRYITLTPLICPNSKLKGRDSLISYYCSLSLLSSLFIKNEIESTRMLILLN